MDSHLNSKAVWLKVTRLRFSRCFVPRRWSLIFGVADLDRDVGGGGGFVVASMQ